VRDRHSRIIAEAAKAELDPFGFQRKGRSRLWFADHGSWLNVVEFTPDPWTKGVSLRNAAHWLWLGHGFLSFDYAVFSKLHAGFETEEQFSKAASEIAREAAAQAAQIDEKLSSFEAAADFVVARARESERMRPSWFGYQAGIVSGLRNKFDDAEYFLGGITDERVIPYAAPLFALVSDPESFVAEVNKLVAQQRATLKLAALNSQPF
jgi:hypothetical protein